MHGRHKRKHASYSHSRTHHEKKRKEKASSTAVDMSSKNKPTLKLSRAGREAELTVSPATRQPLLLSDLRSQIHWGCLRNYYDPYSLDWCSLTKKPSQVTVIVVEGISMAVLEDLSLRSKKVKACYEELLQDRLRAPLDNATARYGTPHCDGWSQADQSHLAAGNGTQDSTTTPSTNNWNNGHAQGGEVPEACVSSTLQAFMPNCCRYLDVRLEMVAPSKHQQAILHELFLIRCPSSVAASIKSGNLICPRTLVEVMPNPELCKKHKSDESDWKDYDTNPCSGEVPAYEDIMKIWSISQSADTLKTSLKWTKPNKKVVSTNAVQSDQFDRRKMMLSLEQLIKLKFPLPACVSNMFAEDHLHSAKSRFQDWSFCVATKDVYAKVTPSSPMFGVDCEFVLEASEARTALGSIAIVNEHGCLVYQSLVKPDKPVLDYMTPWSGLTEQMLAPVTTSLADVQARIRKYLPPDAILVGHSLENDLRVMKMHHPYVVDTSVLFNLSGSKQTSKLKTLTSHFLHREIQCCSRLGHDPSEDAVATLQLALLKLQHDMTFGNVLLASGGMKTLPEHDLFYNMFEYLEDWHRLHTSSTCPSRPLRERLLLHTTTRHEQQFRRVLEDLQSSAALRVVDSNSDIVNAACNAAMMSDISVMYLEADVRLQSSKVKTRLAALRDLDDSVRRIVHASPAGALISLILAGSTATQASSNGIYMAGVRAL